MSQDCDMDAVDTHPSLPPIEYADHMALDTNDTNDTSTSCKPRTLFSLLLDKRNSLSSRKNRRKHKRQSAHSQSSTSYPHDNTAISPNSSTLSFEERRDQLTTEELRVVKDLTEISDSKWCARGTVVTIHLSSRLHNFRCTISPEEGYYRHGTFSFDITIDKNYPFTPPKIRASHPMFHPNINPHSLVIGLPILTSDWKPVLSLNDVLFALQLLFMQPNIDPIDHQKHSNSVNLQNQALESSKANSNGLDADMIDIGTSRNYSNSTSPNSLHSMSTMGSIQRSQSLHSHHDRSHRNQFAFGVNNHKPHYVQNINITTEHSMPSRNQSLRSDHDEYGIIQNMEAALMFRDEPRKFEKTSQQIIKGGVTMFGTNWQCVERKKMRSAMSSDKEKYDPSLGTQTFRLKDSDTTITKKCSVLRKRRRNEDGEDIFNMKNVKRALRVFASTTGSIRDGISPVSSECSDTLIDGVHSIELGPPEKKRRIERSEDIASLIQYHNENDSSKGIGRNKRSERSYGIRIVQEDGGNCSDWLGSPAKKPRIESPTTFSAFSFPVNDSENHSVERPSDAMDHDCDMI